MNLPGDPMKIWQGCEESYIQGTLSRYLNFAENFYKFTKWFLQYCEKVMQTNFDEMSM